MDVLAYGLLALTTLPPLVPNSALLVTAGVLAARGDAYLPLILLVVVGSALLGDVLMYLAARRFGGPVRSWLRREDHRRALLERTSQHIERYGLPFLIGVRFLPSGRIAGALTSGILHYPLRRFALGAGIAEAIWATYSVGLGYLGSAAAGDPLVAAGIGVGVSLAVAAVATTAQRTARRRSLRRPPAESRPTGSGPPAKDKEAGEEPGDSPEEPGHRATQMSSATPRTTPSRPHRPHHRGRHPPCSTVSHR
ncbi:DedA family protein [Streptomyces sp. NPDC017993]|uniref:DedA family protein n=1 Tax=Streptomyces sp. NPDC017993 TaxID=3365027 RepID=UPI0037B4EF30